MNLNIHNVSLSIKGRLIVNDVSITVNPGEVVGLMGPNGAGKTTTFNLAVPKYLLLDEPFAGIDPLAVNDLKKLILKLSSDGVGILITDHNVRETLLITNKSYVLSEGKILANGSSSELADNPIVKKYYLGDNFKL